MEPIRGVLTIYNPYVVHLLYLKTHYLTQLLEKYYQSKRELDTDAYYRMMRSVILERHHVPWIVRETAALHRRVEKERFPLDLVYCNIEYFLHRFTQLFRTRDESLDLGFIGKHYKCEVAMSRLFLDETTCETLRRSIYAYLEYYYLAPSEAKVTTRVDLLFLLKKTLEEDVEDGGDTNRRVLRYTKEMTAILAQLYLVNEFLALVTLKTREIRHDDVIPRFVYQRDELIPPLLCDEPPDNTYSPEINLLIKMRFELHRLYRQEATINTRYPTVSSSSQQQQHQPEPTLGAAIKDLLFNTGVESGTTTTVDEKDENAEYEAFKHANQNLNAFMVYETPPAVLVPITTGATPQESKLLASRRYIEYDEKTLRARVIKEYAYLRFESSTFVHYEDVVIRLLLEGLFHQAHRGCRKARSPTSNVIVTTSSKKAAQVCLLCDYFKVGDKKMRDLYREIHYYTVNHCYAEEQRDREKLDETLAEHCLTIMAPLVARAYHSLYSVALLYARLALYPMDDAMPLNERRLLTLLDPIKLLDSLAQPLIMDELEEAIARLLTLCQQRLGIEETEATTWSAKTLDLALEVELVKIVINAINAQQTEIEKYERSLTTEVSLNSSALHGQVIHHLKRLYAAYLQCLCHAIRRENEKVTLL